MWIDIPLDVQATVIDETSLRGYTPEPAVPSPELAQQAGRTIELLNGARAARSLPRKWRARRKCAAEPSRRLIDLLGIPVLLTWKAADMLPEEHALYAGRPGAIGQRGANFTQQNADCLVILGARLDMPSIAFSHENFARAATKIMVDIDAAEFGKMKTKLDVPVCGDAAAFVDELLRQAADAATPRPLLLGAACPGVEREVSGGLTRILEMEGRGKPYVLIDVISDEATAQDVLIPGSSGPCSDIFMQAFRVKPGQRIVNAPGLGAMGTGLPGSHRRLPGQRTASHHLRQWRWRLPVEHSGTGNRPPPQPADQVLRPLQRRLRFDHDHAAQLFPGPLGRQRTHQPTYSAQRCCAWPRPTASPPRILPATRESAKRSATCCRHEGPIVCAVDVPADSPPPRA